MQENVNQRTVAARCGSKMTGRCLAKAIQMYLQHNKGKSPKQLTRAADYKTAYAA